MEDLVAVAVQPMEKSVDSVREEKTDVKEMILEAAEVSQVLVVPAVVVLLEEVAAKDSADLEEAERSEVEEMDLKGVKVTQALVVQAAVVLRKEASAQVEGMEVMQL